MPLSEVEQLSQEEIVKCIESFIGFRLEPWQREYILQQPEYFADRAIVSKRAFPDIKRDDGKLSIGGYRIKGQYVDEALERNFFDLSEPGGK